MTAISRPPADDFDPLVEETWESAHRDMKRLRGECPVAHTSAFNGFWLVTKHQDVTQILRDWRTFTTTVQNVVPKVAFTGRRPPLHLDPPEHTPYRRALNPFFTNAKVAAMTAPIREIVIDLLDPLIDAGECDFCVDFVHPLPGRVFAVFFNLPVETAMEIREITKAYDAALQNFDDELVKQASLDLYEIARQMIAARKSDPLPVEDDPTSALLAATDDWGEPLPDDMVLGTLRQFIVVGMIAPIVFLGSVVVHLSEHPELQRQLREDPGLIPAAIQEYLRLFTPYRGFARTARHDVDLGGRRVPKNEPIALAYASANRDEDVFPGGDEFILNRPNIGDHVAFGGGPHRCAGAPLAVELFRITLEELLARTSAIELNGTIRMSGWPEIGTLSVPVKLVRG
jgi:cytochrome P450